MKYGYLNGNKIIGFCPEPQDGTVALTLPVLKPWNIVTYNDGAVTIQGKETDDSDQTVTVDMNNDNAYSESLIMALNSYDITETRIAGNIQDVSVLIPCYGKAAYIMETVQSVIAQTKAAAHIKILLMDSESIALKSDLEALADTVECIESEQLDIVASRMKLAELCTDDHFIFLDADDILRSDYIERVTRYDVDFVFSHVGHYIDGVLTELSVYDGKIERQFQNGNLTFLCKKTAFFSIGLDAAFATIGAEDTDFIMAVLGSDATYCIADTMYYIRRDTSDTFSASSFSAANTHRSEACSALIKKHRKKITNNLIRGCGGLYATTRNAFLRKYLLTGDDVYISCATSALYNADQKHSVLKDELLRYGTKTVAAHFNAPQTTTICFDGDFSDWRFLNCNPTDEQKEIITQFAQGFNFDVLFLKPLENGIMTFSEILDGTDAVMVHNSVTLDAQKGLAMRYEAHTKYVCANLAPDIEMEKGETLPPDLFLAFWRTHGYDVDTLFGFVHSDYIPNIAQIIFTIPTKCNKKCSYCTQNGEYETTAMSEAEIIETVRQDMEKALAAYDVVQFGLVGGETGTWSLSLLRGLAAVFNTQQYPVQLYTNGTLMERTDFNALEEFHSGQILYHVLNWHGTTLEPVNDILYIVVVEETDIPYLADFCDRNRGVRIIFEPCQSNNAQTGIATNVEKLAEISDILRTHGVWPFYIDCIASLLGTGTLSDVQARCRKNCITRTINVYEKTTYTHCCANRKTYDIATLGQDISGEVFDCGNCFVPHCVLER